MNENIKNLWDKAVNLIQDNNDGDWSLDACKDKFAELIVRECAGLVDHVIMEDGTRRSDFIRKHFGVEE